MSASKATSVARGSESQETGSVAVRHTHAYTHNQHTYNIATNTHTYYTHFSRPKHWDLQKRNKYGLPARSLKLPLTHFLRCLARDCGRNEVDRDMKSTACLCLDCSKQDSACDASLLRIRLSLVSFVNVHTTKDSLVLSQFSSLFSFESLAFTHQYASFKVSG